MTVADSTSPDRTALASPAGARYPDLEGRRVLITGAAAGLGLGMARAFADQGCRVGLNDLAGETLDSALAAVQHQAGAQAVALPGSVADAAAVDTVFATLDREWGGLDILINNAGIAMNQPTLELSLEDWQRTLDVNLTGVFLCAKAAATRMMAQGQGCILNIASMYGVVAAPERLAYCTTKGGVAMMSKALAIEWARHGLRVNALAPGYIKTDLVGRLVEAGRISEDQLVRRTPQGRLGSVEEVADLALFLASDRARYITGQVIGIDGGWSAYGYV
ncbi:MAG: SDR family NAD(P)-dependent oxidoreductase [Kiloniellales bacterium]